MALKGILNMQLLVAKDDAMVVATSISSESFKQFHNYLMNESNICNKSEFQLFHNTHLITVCKR